MCFRQAHFISMKRPASYSLSVIRSKHWRPLEVHSLASRAQTAIAGISEADSAIRIGLQVGGVYWEKSEDGERRQRLFQAALPAAACASAVSVNTVVLWAPPVSETDRQRMEDEEKERAYQRRRYKAVLRFVSAFKDERTLKVQSLLSDELTPRSMWNIYELIRADIGGKMKDLATVAQQKQFRGSVNSHSIDKNPRHIVPEGPAASNPMSLEDAQGFIRTFAERYLEKKAGLAPGSDA
jgi:hypothetical protein